MYALLIVNALSMYISDCFFSNTCVFMKQYTYWNIPIVITSFVIEEKNITDFAFLNSVIIFFIFHGMLLFDMSWISLLPMRSNMNYFKYYSASFVVHILPSLIMIYKMDFSHLSDKRMELVFNVFLWAKTTKINNNGICYPVFDKKKIVFVLILLSFLINAFPILYNSYCIKIKKTLLLSSN